MQQSSEKQRFTEKLLLSLVEMHGINNLVFMIPVRKYREFGMLLLEEDDTYSVLPFKITEERYKLDVYHKLQLVTTYPITNERTMEHKESYYVSDFTNLVNNGDIDIYVSNPEGGLSPVYVTLKEVDAVVFKPNLIQRVLNFLWSNSTHTHLLP